jgi:hypothetical protein
MANHMPSTHSSKQFHQFQSVYPIVDAKGVITSYRVIMDGKVANIPASGHIIRPGDPEYPPPTHKAEPTKYTPSNSEVRDLADKQFTCYRDLKDLNLVCLEAHQHAGSNLTKSWKVHGSDHRKEIWKQTAGQPCLEDEYVNMTGQMALQGYNSLHDHLMQSPFSLHITAEGPPQWIENAKEREAQNLTRKNHQEAAQLLAKLAKNEYAQAMAPTLVSAIQSQAALEAKHFIGKSPREKEALSSLYPLGYQEVTAPLSEKEQKQIDRFRQAHEAHKDTYVSADRLPAESEGAQWRGKDDNRSVLLFSSEQFLDKAAQVRHTAEQVLAGPSAYVEGVRLVGPLAYPPSGPDLPAFGGQLQEAKEPPKIIPVQIVGEPEYSTLPVDSSKGFVRRIAEENGRKMVVVKEVDGTIQIPHEARFRFDRTFGREFDQESAKDKYSMLQVIANGGEADPKAVNVAWQKMSDNQKAVISELKMETPSTGIGMAIKSDAFSKFHEATGRPYDPQSGLDKINLSNISSGKPQMSPDEWARNPSEPTPEAISTVEIFKPAPEPQQVPETPEAAPQADHSPVESILENPAPSNVVAQSDPEETGNIDPRETPEEAPENEEGLDEEERRKRTNAGQAVGDYMDTSVDIF